MQQLQTMVCFHSIYFYLIIARNKVKKGTKDERSVACSTISAPQMRTVWTVGRQLRSGWGGFVLSWLSCFSKWGNVQATTLQIMKKRKKTKQWIAVEKGLISGLSDYQSCELCCFSLLHVMNHHVKARSRPLELYDVCPLRHFKHMKNLMFVTLKAFVFIVVVVSGAGALKRGGKTEDDFFLVSQQQGTGGERRKMPKPVSGPTEAALIYWPHCTGLWSTHCFRVAYVSCSQSLQLWSVKCIPHILI